MRAELTCASAVGNGDHLSVRSCKLGGRLRIALSRSSLPLHVTGDRGIYKGLVGWRDRRLFAATPEFDMANNGMPRVSAKTGRPRSSPDRRRMESRRHLSEFAIGRRYLFGLEIMDHSDKNSVHSLSALGVRSLAHGLTTNFTEGPGLFKGQQGQCECVASIHAGNRRSQPSWAASMNETISAEVAQRRSHSGFAHGSGHLPSAVGGARLLIEHAWSCSHGDVVMRLKETHLVRIFSVPTAEQ